MQSTSGSQEVDGRLNKLKGKLPATFEYKANEVELAFALANPKGSEQIAVQAFVDGTKPRRRSESKSGIHELFVSFGYAEWAGGTLYCGGGDMSPENVAILVKNSEMPPEGIGWSIIKRTK